MSADPSWEQAFQDAAGDELWAAGILPVAGQGPRPILDRFGAPVDLSIGSRPNPRRRRVLDLDAVPAELREFVADGHICARPIVVRSEGQAGRLGVDTDTGEVLAIDGGTRSFVRPCGNRREHACPHCSKRYRHDLYRVTMAELEVDRPLTFVTLTADGMAVEGRKTCPIHTGPTIKLRKDGTEKVTPRACNGCRKFHARDSSLIGAPVNPDHFDYRRAASFNAASGALWTAWLRALKRELRDAERSRLKDSGLTRREITQRARAASEVKVLRCAELQARGVVHHHALIVTIMNAGLLRRVTDKAAAFADGYRHTYSASAQGCHVKHVYKGERLDGNDDPGKMHAAYLGKYVCKSASSLVEAATGPVAIHYGRLADAVCALEDERSADELDEAWEVWADDEVSAFVALSPVPPFPDMVGGTCCVALRDDGAYEYAALLSCPCERCVAWRRKRRALEYLGMRGHVFTRSRAWSLSFSAIRLARVAYRVAQADAARGDDPPIVYGEDGWIVIGVGLARVLALDDGLSQLAAA